MVKMTTDDERLEAANVEVGLRSMRPVYRAFWRGGQAVFKVYFRWRVLHRERIPLQGPLLIAANHESYIDPLILGGALTREVHFLARAGALRFPLWGRLLQYFNAIPIKPEHEAGGGLRAGLEVLERGDALVLFPEGARTFDGKMQSFRPGAGLIVARSRAPVLPVRFFGMYSVYGRHLRWPRPYRIVVTIGRPLTFEKQWAEMPHASKSRQKEIYREITDEIRAAILRLKPEPDCEE